jgi:hypothetical protein
MNATIYRIRFIISLSLLAPHLAPAQGLIIPSGTYVIASNGNIVTTSNWINNGLFTHNGGTLVFAGSSQTLGGSSATLFNNITVEPGSKTTIISAGQQVYGIVQSNDTLNANGNLTLISTAAQTALIDGSGTGEVVGNLTMQRYLPSGFGYKYFSSPFQADTVGDFSREINLGTSFPDVYSYNENLASAGWVTYTTSSSLLIPLAGYAVNFGTSSAPLTVSMTGVVSNHTISSTLYNHNNTYTLGFNLAGNPYPSPINWDAPGGWTKTNIDNAVYYFSAGDTNQYTGTYSSYVNGVSSNGIAGNMIAAMQGFFVHVSNGSYPVTGTLAVNNSARNTYPSIIFFGITIPDGPPPLLRLTAGFADEDTLYDPAVFYFKNQAPDIFDKQLDALKLMNTHTGVPNLYSVSKDQLNLSIFAIPISFDTLKTIPLGLKTAKDGWITFNARDIEHMPDGLYIYLTDTKTGVSQDLQQSPSCRLYLPAGEYTGRFFLNFSTKKLSSGNTPGIGLFSVYSASGQLFVNSNLGTGQKGDLVIFNMLGQAVWRQEIVGSGNNQINAGFAAGVYIVSLRTQQNSQSVKVFIGSQ